MVLREIRDRVRFVLMNQKIWSSDECGSSAIWHAGACIRSALFSIGPVIWLSLCVIAATTEIHSCTRRPEIRGSLAAHLLVEFDVAVTVADRMPVRQQFV